MTDTTWDERYSRECEISKEPAQFLKDGISNAPLGKALDIAAGNGHNSVYLATNGYEVDAVDYSAVALDKLNSFVQRTTLSINTIHADLTNFQIPKDTYDLIVNFYFLERSLIPLIKRGLKKGGMLIFETYTVEQRRFGRPHNPDYLLKQNELLKSFIDLYVIYYHERVERKHGDPKAIASLLAQKR